MGDSKPHIEPNADTRQMAEMLHQQFVALMQAGFSEQQALKIIGQILAAVASAQ